MKNSILKSGIYKVNLLEKLIRSSNFIKEKINFNPRIGLILGSGLGSLADEIESSVKIPYEKIPYFPVSTVEGHAGHFIVGKLEGKVVAAMQGRVHYYEGYSMQEVTYPVRLMKKIGVEILIVTNACGGLNPELYPGALMFIEDHINFTGDNPLIGENFDELGPRFPDMSSAYDKDLLILGRSVGKKLGIETKTGVHTAVSGPNFVSKAELRMIRKFGSDTIGMSTIPEVIVAVHSGIKALGICCVTDMAIPDQLEPVDHEKVMKQALKTKPKFIKLVRGIIKKLTIDSRQ